MLTLLLGIALASPTLEIPVSNPLEGSRTVRRLGGLGLGASKIRVAGAVRIRVEVASTDSRTVEELSAAIRDRLGLPVLVFEAFGESSPTVKTTGAEAFLGEVLSEAETVRFTFTREFQGVAIAHDWWASGARRSVTITPESDALSASRLLLEPDAAWLWTEEGRREASHAQVSEWSTQLGPDAILAEAYQVGFGRQVPPEAGCRLVASGWTCVDTEPEDLWSWVVLRGRQRTDDGHWVPGMIERYEAGKLSDRVFGIVVDTDLKAPDYRFDASNERIHGMP